MSNANGFVPGRGYSQEDWDEVSDNPELTDEELAQARPMSEAMPELYARLMESIAVRDATKSEVSIWLDKDIAERLKSTGPDWQANANAALRRWLDDAA